MRRSIVTLALFSFLLSACDSGNPVAPAPPVAPVPGDSFTIELKASPPEIPAGSGEPATITMTVKREADGQPPADGTLASLSTDNGNFGPDSAGNPQTMVSVGLVGGVGQASLFPAEAAGSATVLGQVGSSVASLEVTFFEPTPETVFLTAVEPSTGGPSGGEVVTVRGGGFVEPLRVQFGGGLGRVVSATAERIEVVTPASTVPVGAGQSLVVDVVVTTALDQAEMPSATLPAGFTYVDRTLPFFLTAVDPNRGKPEGGDIVRIRGGGFQPPVRVDFGGKPGEHPTVMTSGTVIAVTVPASAMPVPAGDSLVVDVTVTNAVDQGEPPSATLTGGYTYVADPPVEAPQVTSISPPTGPNDGGTEVTVLGSGFDDPTVFFGAIEATAVTRESATRITATTPPAGAANENRAVDVTVRNRTSGLEGTLPMAFTYGRAPIVLSALSPARGTYEGGTTVEITGQGFSEGGTVAVELADVRQMAEAVVDARTVSFETVGVAIAECPPEGELPQTGITVIDLATGDSASADLVFTYVVPMPTIRRVSPTIGPQLGNTLVNIEGPGTEAAAFEEPVQVAFVAGAEEFAAVVQSRTESLVRVSSPRVPNTVFPEVDCVFDDGSEDGAPGKRWIEVTVDVRVTNVETGCTDTFGNAFTYRPTDPDCRQVGQ